MSAENYSWTLQGRFGASLGGSVVNHLIVCCQQLTTVCRVFGFKLLGIVAIYLGQGGTENFVPFLCPPFFLETLLVVLILPAYRFFPFMS